MNEPKDILRAPPRTPLEVQRLKRLAAGLATRAELRAIRAEERAASPRGLHALKSGRARL